MSVYSNKQIIFDFDNDNRPMRETKLEGSLFEPQYIQALRQIDTYLRELDLEKTEEGHERNINDTEFISDDIDYNNNIFSFTGGRGTGKTSCMISVASMLIDNENINVSAFPYIAKAHFATIDLIDPAYFDKAHNLVSLFLAKLYKKYEQVVSIDSRQAITRDNKQHFLQKYRDAHSQLQRLYYGRSQTVLSDEDLMEYVEEVSASVKLKRTIQDLVDAYLACLPSRDTILILRIDDVDMDIRNASMMIETMRKYFIQPNLLVFVSCDLNQLQTIKQRDFGAEFNDKESKDWCHELADRYLAKVFPHNHRIQMPEPGSYHNYRLRVLGNFQTDAGKAVASTVKKEHDNEKYCREFVSVKQAIPELILKKTRYLFYNTNYYESYIVPRNLRELRQLMKLLVTMPDYKADGKEHPHNRTLFKEYFYENWVQTNLKVDDVKYVQKLLSVHDLSLFNKTLLSIISERFIYEPIEKLEKNKNTKAMAVDKHISTADILDVFAKIEPGLVQEQDRKLIFFFKSYYSILLYDSYCEILEELEGDIRPTKRKMKGEEGHIDNEIIRPDALAELFNYEKLVGGSFIKLDEKSDKTSLNANKFKDYVDKCEKLCSKKRITDAESAQILLAEVLILSIYSCSQDNSSISSVNVYKQMSKLSISKDTKYLISAGAFLFNITRYEQCICRFSESFYDKVKNNKPYKNFKKRISSACKLKNDYDWLHLVSIRNFEVLQNIITKRNFNKDTDEIGLFFDELKYLSGYAFPLYEHPAGDEKHYTIHLTFLSTIMKDLESLLTGKECFKDFVENLDRDNPQNLEDEKTNPANLQKSAPESHN